MKTKKRKSRISTNAYKTPLSGIVLIDKPEGPTSFDIVAQLRKLTGVKKIGHAGTLDPMASGLLVVAIGRSATKNLGLYAKSDKTYLAEIEMGKTSDTYDRLGKVEPTLNPKKPSLAEIKSALKEFRGEILQLPPAFSAKKIAGVRAYTLARQGIKPELKKAKVTVRKIKLISYKWPKLKLELSVSSGTYIRSIASDLGQRLKTGAMLTELRRTKQGSFNIEDAQKPAVLQELPSNLSFAKIY